MTDTKIYLGDCKEVMQEFPDNLFDTIITDPPYGLSFMGKDWDHGIPGIAFWKEMLRICKPGASLLAFGGTRTHHRLTCAIEDAGWEIRDCVMWLYGQGFPKSHNISKAIDHAAKLWDGWGTALKPAWEPIIVAMKPLDGTYANNAIKWDVAGLNIDGCRIESEPELAKNWQRNQSEFANGSVAMGTGLNPIDLRGYTPSGRWPANLILDDISSAMLDEMSGVGVSKQAHRGAGIKGPTFRAPEYESTVRGHNDTGGASRFFYCAKASKKERNIGLSSTYTVRYDVNSVGELRQKDVSMVLVELLKRATSELEVKWLIGESGKSIMGLCQMDYLSTILTGINKITESKILNLLTHSFINDCIADANYETENGGSLAESVVNSNQLQSNIIPEKMEALARGVKLVVSPMLSIISDGANWKEMTNIHNTVKPIALLRYLVRLTKTPTGGLVLDPFMGSGTTGIACQLEDRNFIGIEKEQEYFDIATKRLKRQITSGE